MFLNHINCVYFVIAFRVTPYVAAEFQCLIFIACVEMELQTVQTRGNVDPWLRCLEARYDRECRDNFFVVCLYDV